MTHMETMRTQLPFLSEKPIFNKVANIASLSALNKEEMQEYQDSVDAYRTTVAAFDFKYKQGVQQGVQLGIIESARNMIKAGFDKMAVIKALNLSPEVANSL